MAIATLMPRVVDRHTLVDGHRWPGLARRLAGPPVSRSAPLAVPVMGIARAIRVQFASTESDWEEALQLVTDNYRARGYEAAGAGMRFTSYHALPDTTVLTAKEGGRVLATFSLVADNVLLGLPLETLYRAEVAQLRRSGRRILETTCLADRDLSVREFVAVFLTLIQFAWQYGVTQGANATVITVNPRHRDFYTKVLGYVPLGPRRAYDQVQGNPAEAFYLDADLMRRTQPLMYQRMFGQPLPRAALAVPPLPAPLVRRFAQRSSQTEPRAVDDILRYVAAFGSPRRW